MPRGARRTTQTGAPAQPSTPVAGQMYGKGVEQQRLAEAIPLPNVAGQPVGGPPAGMPAPQAAPAPTLDDVLAQAKGLASGGGTMFAPTARPNEPVTHGLPVGPGAGPEILGTPIGTPTGRWMRDLAMRTGNPYLQELADRIGA